MTAREATVGIHPHIKRKVRQGRLVNNALVYGTSAAAGFGARLALKKLVFVAAGFVVTSPGAAVAIPAAVLAGGVAGGVSNVARIWITSKIKGQTLPEGWLWKAARKGFVKGLLGAFIGAELAQFLPVDHIWQWAQARFAEVKESVYDATHIALPVVLSLPATPPPPAASGPIVAVPPPAATPVLPPAAAPPIISVPQQLWPPNLSQWDRFADFVRHSRDFHRLPPHVRGIGLRALRLLKPDLALHFDKEASFHLINGHGHDLAMREAGAALVRNGVDFVHTDGLHNITAHQLLRDDAYLEKLHALARPLRHLRHLRHLHHLRHMTPIPAR